MPLFSRNRRKEEQRARYQVEKFEKEKEAGDEEASALISSLTHADVMDNGWRSPVQPAYGEMGFQMFKAQMYIDGIFIKEELAVMWQWWRKVIG